MNKLTKIVMFSLMFLAAACSSSDSDKNGSQYEEQSMDTDEAPSSMMNPKTNESSNGFISSSATSHKNSQNRKRKSANGFISSSAAAENGDTSMKFIRTAKMKFRVTDVTKATYQIEDLVKDFDGFVTHTHLNSNINRKDVTALSPDSSLETIWYSVSNNMTLRVPNTKLDTTLKSIANLIDYMDYRIINAKNVALDILSNKLKQKRAKLSESQQTTVVESGDKNVITSRKSRDNPLRKQIMADEAKLANLYLEDQIKFSTIQVSIYQREETKRWLIPNDKNIDAYKPGFGERFIVSLQRGWEILAAFILFITKLWGLLLLGIIVYVLYKLFGHKLKIKPRK